MIEFIKSEYPLHYLIWINDSEKLKEELVKNLHDVEKIDNRGRTPLMLSVTLKRLECSQILLEHGVNVNCVNQDGWTVVQEAVATGDPILLDLVLERRDFQRYSSRIAGIPELLQKLKQAPDFYVEMKWEFTSWVPLFSKLCPSDTYKVYKQGSNVRIDTTLLGFEQTSWKRGNKSYIFKGENDNATMIELDHDTREAFVNVMQVSADCAESILMPPTQIQIEQRLTAPLQTTYINIDKISFERSKSGIWGWRSDKTEIINGYECKVYAATNVELVTRTRIEHLADSDKERAKASQPQTPLQNILGIASGQVEEKTSPSHNSSENDSDSNIKLEEYFDSKFDLNGRDIGRPKEESVKIQKFRATLWLSENYPLSLQEQIMPIVDLMAISNSHFAKLRDFIQMQLPSGFPVKIEIPLFHVLNARITFGNIFGLDNHVDNVNIIESDESDVTRMHCIVDDVCFEVPKGYRQQINNQLESNRQFNIDEDDDLLQYAIQRSLMEKAQTENEQVDIWEALQGQRPSSNHPSPNLMSDEEKQLQRAIEESLAIVVTPNPNLNTNDTNVSSSPDSDLEMAILLSQKENEEEEKLRLKEEKMLEEIMRLSLTEK